MFGRQGSFVVALVILTLFVSVQQGVLAPQVPPVVFKACESSGYYVELPVNLTSSKFTRIVHVQSKQDALSHVSHDVARRVLRDYFQQHQLYNGQRIIFNKDDKGKWFVQVDYISAERRMTLGVSLHPDRMSNSDWLALPGVGERMARKIVENQERYGKFYTFEALKRVKGIGTKTLDAWRSVF